ncbi:uncharacterized protein LOC114532390 [Dendronephthya gigantea]|uniref:uncharacterized protein LOC114532390 n=1 Tax=Dendronephthya gigantea TaxID=151771 RepID=UPI00106CBFF6|nr:uncharacterized protein LOC114532390 [Dendronephthya gigantea]
MIDLKEKPRRCIKRKFEENGRIQPKETLLDMSVSKLAKAQTRVNLEPSLRKTVMIVNTIRKLEQEIEIGRTKTLKEASSFNHCSAKTNNYHDTRSEKNTVFSHVGTQDYTEGLQKLLGSPLDTREETFVCENNSETHDRCPEERVAKSCTSDDTFIDLAQSTEMKFRNRFEESSNSLASIEVSNTACEINFAEVDISLYDYDASMVWQETGMQVDETEQFLYKPAALSTFTKRCSDDLKLGKSTDNTFADDLDQIMQVLVGI